MRSPILLSSCAIREFCSVTTSANDRCASYDTSGSNLKYTQLPSAPSSTFATGDVAVDGAAAVVARTICWCTRIRVRYTANLQNASHPPGYLLDDVNAERCSDGIGALDTGAGESTGVRKPLQRLPQSRSLQVLWPGNPLRGSVDHQP